MKAAFFDLEGWEIPTITQHCKDAGIEVIKTSTDSLDVTNTDEIKDAEIISVFLSRVDAAIIEALPNLKLISARTTGFDYIDTDFALTKGITVVNVPTYGSDTVAEYAMTLLLVLARRLTMTFVQSLFGIFDQKITRGNDVAGKTLGIIGTGKIGQKLAKMASGFDMNIICYDTLPCGEICTKFNAQYVSLETLFKTSDFISIHLPYTNETHHLINFGTLNLLKKGVIIINTARGPIVNTSAIRRGLKEKILGGVAMDTFEGENIWLKEENILDKKGIPSSETFRKALEAFYLLKFENVILTPHNAFNSYEAVQRILETALTDITNFSKNRELAHRVI